MSCCSTKAVLQQDAHAHAASFIALLQERPNMHDVAGLPCTRCCNTVLALTHQYASSRATALQSKCWAFLHKTCQLNSSQRSCCMLRANTAGCLSAPHVTHTTHHGCLQLSTCQQLASPVDHLAAITTQNVDGLGLREGLSSENSSSGGGSGQCMSAHARAAAETGYRGWCKQPAATRKAGRTM
jgi:hypothetical protein